MVAFFGSGEMRIFLIPKFQESVTMCDDTFLSEICRRVLQELAPVRREAFVQAFSASLLLDGSYISRNVTGLPNVLRPYDIEREYGFSFNDQRAYGISLTRPAAYQFLRQYTAIRKFAFDKRYTRIYYEEQFGTQPCYMSESSKVMLLTYAEWLHFLKINIQPDLPKELEDLI